MGKRVLNVDCLSASSIKRLQKDLQKYSDDLTGKCRELVQRLAEQGVQVAEAKIGESPLGKYITLKTDITEEEAGCKAILTATGEVMESDEFAPFYILLAVEFGAGIHYNPAPNPNADKFGLGVGTFPGQIHAFDPGGWYYWDEDKQAWKHSFGVKATMPMYNASVEIIQNIVNVAHEVFEG